MVEKQGLREVERWRERLKYLSQFARWKKIATALLLRLKGMPQKRIARKLRIAEKTIRKYWKNLKDAGYITGDLDEVAALAKKFPDEFLKIYHRVEPFLKKVASIYSKLGTEYDDAYQEACYSLCKAVRRYEPDKGAFMPYLIFWTASSMRRYYLWNSRVMKMPEKAFLLKDTLDNKEAEKLAKELGVKKHTILDAFSLQRYAEVSIDDYEELIGDDGLEDSVINAEMREKLKEALRRLNDKERFVIFRKYWDNMSFKQIGSMLGLSKESIRQLHNKTLKKLKKFLTA